MAQDVVAQISRRDLLRMHHGCLFDLMYPDTGSFQFWIEEAQKCSGGTILELACGTGGISIALV